MKAQHSVDWKTTVGTSWEAVASSRPHPCPCMHQPLLLQKMTKFTSMHTRCLIYATYVEKIQKRGLRSGMVSAVAAFGGLGIIWYRYPREEGVSHIRYQPPAHLAKPELLTLTSILRDLKRQERDLKEQENLDKFWNESESSWVSHGTASTVPNNFPGRNYYRLHQINFNSPKNASNQHQI